MEDEDIFDNTTGASGKFVCHWIRRELITRVLHNKRNKVIDDICIFND